MLVYEMSTVPLKTVPKPESIFFEERKDFFISNRILIANYDKLLVEADPESDHGL